MIPNEYYYYIIAGGGVILILILLILICVCCRRYRNKIQLQRALDNGDNYVPDKNNKKQLTMSVMQERKLKNNGNHDLNSNNDNNSLNNNNLNAINGVPLYQTKTAINLSEDNVNIYHTSENSGDAVIALNDIQMRQRQASDVVKGYTINKSLIHPGNKNDSKLTKIMELPTNKHGHGYHDSIMDEEIDVAYDINSDNESKFKTQIRPKISNDIRDDSNSDENDVQY
mmetsp:Transcript_102606/g.125438  ORF Transcript_102606/g.125438 Transcript_102606/m.125438 type:complete len:227 (+) Transcript_102606:89-769(+)